MATETAVEQITFESKGTNYRIIRVSSVDGVSPTGATYLAQPEVVIDFSPTGAVTLTAGEQMLPDGPTMTDEAGRMVLDDRNQPRREQQDAIEYLLHHRDFGVQFWVRGLKPGTPLPTEADFSSAVMDAVIDLNGVTLARLRDQELRTHARASLMAQVDTAIRRVAEMRAEAGEHAPAEPDDVELPSGNSPFDLGKRPVNARDMDEAARRAAELASPDDPRYAGGV